MTPEQLADWLAGFVRAWENQDTELFVTLFTDDATYQDTPYTVPFQARDFRAFWDGLAREQSDNSMRFGESHLLGSDRAVAFWTCETTTLRRGGQRCEASGVMLLTFSPNHRCSSLQEWQHGQVLGTPLATRTFPPA